MKHLGRTMMVALLSMSMTSCFLVEKSSSTLNFSSTPPTTVVVGEEYRYNITVTPETTPNYEITVAGAPDWLELQTAAAQPVKVGSFAGLAIHLAADGEDIYFWGSPSLTSELDRSPGVYKTQIDGSVAPEIVFRASESVNQIGGLFIDNKMLYIAETLGQNGSAKTAIYRLNLAETNAQPKLFLEVPIETVSIAVKDQFLYLANGRNGMKIISLANPRISTTNYGSLYHQVFGLDAYGYLHAATASGTTYSIADKKRDIVPMYNSEDVPCTRGIAGYAGQGTYFANTSCYINEKQQPGNLRFVSLDAPSDTNGEGRVVYREGEIIAGPALGVTVTDSGQVVWADLQDATLKTFTVQQNTLVGTPTEAGNYDITLTLPNGATQSFTLTVTEPPVSYDVAGTVYGLQGTLQLSNNSTDIVSISTAAEGSSPFSFTKPLQQGEAFDVAVFANPAGQTCSVREEPAAAGTMGNADVELSIDCEYIPYNINGAVEGLNGELELLLSSEQGEEELLVSEDGDFNFTGEFILGDEYSLTIKTQPIGQMCELAVSFVDDNGEATNPIVSGPVDLPIVCTTNETPRTLSVTVAGLVEGVSVEMRALGPQDGRWEQEDKAFATGTAAFSNTLLDSEAFAIAILTAPDGYICSITDEAPLYDVADGLGFVAGNVSVTVSCEQDPATIPRTLSITVTGLPDGSSVTMSATGPIDGRWAQESKAFSTGTASFENTMLDGEVFDISKTLDPDGYSCSITGESPLYGPVDGLGTVDGNVTISVSCEAIVVSPPRTLSVTVIGLPADGTTVAMRAFGPDDGRWLQENKAFATGTAAFNNTMLDGETFDIRKLADPTGYTCTITDEAPLDGAVDGFGTIDGDVTITVTCSN